MDLSTAPVIRKTRNSTMPPIRDHKTLISLPVMDKFSCMNDMINFLNATAKELNVIYHIFCFFIYQISEFDLL